ncbi:MAG: DEAD/DEAH box helicase [Cyclobacteriaceae bacterium]|nr:DEAD/DEAH box helicase [Cyclobacteriaceae bacterium]
MNSLRQKRRPRTNSSPTQNPNHRKQSNRRKGPAVSTIDPRLFVKKATPLADATFHPSFKIQDLAVDARIKANLLSKGYIFLTEIQEHSIQPVLEGNDVMGIAQTGTGKTAAFLVPIVNNLLGKPASFQVLVVVPTRELAVQVEDELKSIVKGLNISSACFIGGTSVGKDISRLRRPCHFVIGTPGRLIDLARQNALHFRDFKTLILDEFDRLLDMGFLRDIKTMLAGMTNRKQTVLFSATEETGQKKLIQSLLNNPVEVRVSTGNVTGDHIDQEIVTVKAGEKKLDILVNMFRDEAFHKVIVFAETKRGVSQVRKNLQHAGIRVDEIHGNKSQNYRLKALNDFKSGKIQALIATDVAARGLDISEVTHVINFQPPRDFDSYIHRIGRTGRAGKGGKAYTFIN